MNVNINNLSIKEKFEKYIYILDDAPRLLHMNFSEVFVNKYAPYPNEIDSLDSFNWHENKVQTEKLKGKCSGFWDLIVNTINSIHFDSREKLDYFYVPKKYQTSPISCKNLDKISIKDAFEMLNVKVSCNMEYFLKHPGEMEKDLNRKINESEFNSPRLEQELFYIQMCKIFGDSEPSNDKLEQVCNDSTNFEKVFMLKDFHLLFNDGNCIYATAKRGNFYLLFFFYY